jgi:hypothetical protein
VIIKSIPWCPSKEFTDLVTRELVIKHSLKAIDYGTLYGLTALTFVFSNGQRSPPEGSYKNEPKMTWRVP